MTKQKLISYNQFVEIVKPSLFLVTPLIPLSLWNLVFVLNHQSWLPSRLGCLFRLARLEVTRTLELSSGPRRLLPR